MSILTRPVLEINLNNLLENYKSLQKMAGNAVAAAVVKDDAYGIGASRVVEKLYNEAGCRNFFTAYGYEGAEVRKIAKDANIFVLQGMGEDEIEVFKENKLTPVVFSMDSYKIWKQNRIEGIHPVIQIETGLNRLGFREHELKELSEDERLEFSYVMSHLSCADENSHFMNERQLDKFKELKERFFPETKATISASDGVFLGSDFCFDMVRLGAACYGINTTAYRPNTMRPVVFVKASVLQVEELKAGEYVGYSASYQAPTDQKIAIISIGYGDGLPRSLSNKGKVFIKNIEAKILGRVSMDNIIVDITNIKDIKSGDFADILNEQYTLDDMGKDAGTIGYEIISRIGKGKRFVI